MPVTQLITNGTANADSSSVYVGSKGRQVFTVMGEGTWDTSTMALALQLEKDDAASWAVYAIDELTADGTFSVEAEAFAARLNLRSVGGSTDVNGWLAYN
jgi:hypothetical protein